MPSTHAKHLSLTRHYDQYPVSPETELWLAYSQESTTFRLWSPVAEEVWVYLYHEGHGGQPFDRLRMHHDLHGIWQLTLHHDLQGTFYTFRVKEEGSWLAETPGIYATAVGVNGQRAMVLDLATTNPPGWEEDRGPTVEYPNEVVLYEAHVRDMTISPEAGTTYPGKFLGLVEKGTTNPAGLSTGLDHLFELGVTHIHLLPVFDFFTVDEAEPERPQYNWGYDPQNYNVPEGSYATDPFRPEVRIKEFKQMVKDLHDHNLGVIMDVVYNHTGLTEHSNFNQEVPGYYYRHLPGGGWSNASGCDNETASERTMVRKFIIASCCFWAREYHIDGFRFDLMAIHDIETMNLLAEELQKINPQIIIYGEGWTAGYSPLPDSEKALKSNTPHLNHVAAFSDDIRDALKGSVFDKYSRGFVSGAGDTTESVKFGIVGSTAHHQVDIHRVSYSPHFWAREPWQSVSYVSCHDNHTLFDKLAISCPEVSLEERIKMNLLADAVVLTSQGIPFIHAGSELLRTKNGEHNSFNLPDAVNQMPWGQKTVYEKVFNFYKSLIALRKAHPAFYMPTAAMVRQHLSFLEAEPGLIGYLLLDHPNQDSWKNILVYYNARRHAETRPLTGKWQVATMGEMIDPRGKTEVKKQVEIPALSMVILFQEVQ